MGLEHPLSTSTVIQTPSMSKGEPVAKGVSLVLGTDLEMVTKAVFLLSQGNKEESLLMERGDRSHSARLNAAIESLAFTAQPCSG